MAAPNLPYRGPNPPDINLEPTSENTFHHRKANCL